MANQNPKETALSRLIALNANLTTQQRLLAETESEELILGPVNPATGKNPVLARVLRRNTAGLVGASAIGKAEVSTHKTPWSEILLASDEGTASPKFITNIGGGLNLRKEESSSIAGQSRTTQTTIGVGLPFGAGMAQGAKVETLISSYEVNSDGDTFTAMAGLGGGFKHTRQTSIPQADGTFHRLTNSVKFGGDVIGSFSGGTVVSENGSTTLIVGKTPPQK